MKAIEKRIARYKLIEKHIELVRHGKYETARLVFRLLKNGHITLGLRDADSEAERIFEEAGLLPRYGRGYWSARFTI